jgi:hypothetical protein
MHSKLVVEKKLACEHNLSRHDLGPEAFVSNYGPVLICLLDPDPLLAPDPFWQYGSGRHEIGKY